MSTNTLILGLYARTSIAAGTGQNLGSIDLPIMREAPTGYPVIFGSAVKGALREKFERETSTDKAKVLFGDDSAGGSGYAGAVIVSDARLLLLPVRSLTTHFRWVTCPYILKRLKEDLNMIGKKASFSIPKLTRDEVVTTTDANELYFEEFKFSNKKEDLADVIETLVLIAGGDLKETLKQQLAIVSDDMFAHLSRFATPVNAHIAIDNTTKTVKNGALWYEETLPSETLLYTILIANASRKSGDTQTQASIIKDRIKDHLVKNDFVQVGGNETVGMGWCKVVCHD